MKVFLDLDGVLADFVASATSVLGAPPTEYEAEHGTNAYWAKLRAVPDFYATLPLMPDADALWRGVISLTGCEPIILTGVPKWETATRQKLAWAEGHFPTAAKVITCAARDKARYALPGDVLIDDRPTYIDHWRAAGGVFIVHTSAKTSLAELARVLGTPC